MGCNLGQKRTTGDDGVCRVCLRTSPHSVTFPQGENVTDELPIWVSTEIEAGGGRIGL